MMLHSLSRFLLLVFLVGGGFVLVNASDNEISDGHDNFCQAMTKLMSAVNIINNKYDEQAACPGLNEKVDRQTEELEQLKEKLDRSLASTAAISTINEEAVRQAKILEQLTEKLDRSLASTAAIATLLEKHSAGLLSHDERLKSHVASQTDLYQIVQESCAAERRPKDCSEIRAASSNVSGVYRLYPGSGDQRIEMDVYCDFSSLGQSWLVFQRRKDGSVDFERSWKDYERGFGDLNEEFWLGNEKLSLLTMNKKYKLRVDLEDFLGQKRYAEYSGISVKPAIDSYRLTLGVYSGTAGDSLAWQNGTKFSTNDMDNDADADRSCAKDFHGGFWYIGCHQSNLNGLYLKGPHESYGDGIEWYHWHGYHYSLKTTEMKIAAVI